MASTRLCSVPGCGKRHFGRGYCQMHPMRLWKRGDVHTVNRSGRKNGSQQFYETMVLPHTSDDCLVWPYSRMKNGYGTLSRGSKNYLVSRMVCMDLLGPPPRHDSVAAHSCNNGHLGCVNPKHLRWATPAENTEDSNRHADELQAVYGFRHLGKTRVPMLVVRAILSDKRPTKVIAETHGVTVSYVYSLRHRFRGRDPSSIPDEPAKAR